VVPTTPKIIPGGFPRDPFFDGVPFKAEPPAPTPSPFQFFTDPPEQPRPTDSQGGIIHARSAMSEQVQPLESYQTRALLLGLTRLLQRRGILGTDELQRFIANLIEAGELSESGK